MSYKIFVGIDPGASGGIGALNLNGQERVVPMPATAKDLWDELNQIEPSITTVFIEKVHSMPGQGVVSTFKFGKGYGMLIGMLTALGVRYEDVQPRAWQKELGIPVRDKNRDESKTEFKNRLKAKAQQLFPSIKFTLKTCDAILIAEYCKRMNS